MPNGEDWYEPYIRGNEQGVFVKNADRSDNSVGRVSVRLIVDFVSNFCSVSVVRW